MTKNKKQSKI